MVRYAFTLIELIFAIVIIAISVISLPMMSQVTAKSMENSLAQEAIFTALAEINVATAYVWDETSLIDTNLSSGAGANELSRVVFTTGTPGNCFDTGIAEGTTTIKRRVGHIHRRCLNDLTVLPYSTTATDCVDSLNASEHDYNATYEGSAATTSATGYKIAYESSLDVERCDGTCIDFGVAGNINMKEITVSIRDASDQSIVTRLRTYSANIGEVAYNNRFIP